MAFALLLYTGSVFITIATIFQIFVSVVISYFLYIAVFRIPFFPFMNLLVIVILVGIGVDDAFIFCHVWSQEKSQKNTLTFEKLFRNTLRHATLSMFVTSITTAAAFFASYVSKVTVLRCFAIFAGTAVLVNLVVMVTCMPAIVVMQEKWCSFACACFINEHCGFYESAMNQISTVFLHWLPWLIVKLRYIWLLVLGALGIVGIILVFVYPKLKLPSSNDFQLFAHDHPFEVYDLQIKRLLWFENSAGEESLLMPLTFIWGVNPVDDGYYLNPNSKGTLNVDENFDFETPDAQQFLHKFCKRLRTTKYYQSGNGLPIHKLFYREFQNVHGSWM